MFKTATTTDPATNSEYCINKICKDSLDKVQRLTRIVFRMNLLESIVVELTVPRSVPYFIWERSARNQLIAQQPETIETALNPPMHLVRLTIYNKSMMALKEYAYKEVEGGESLLASVWYKPGNSETRKPIGECQLTQKIWANTNLASTLLPWR